MPPESSPGVFCVTGPLRSATVSWMPRQGQAWMQARQVWQQPGVCTALPFSTRMEPEGQTRWQMPQPTQSPP